VFYEEMQNIVPKYKIPNTVKPGGTSIQDGIEKLLRKLNNKISKCNIHKVQHSHEYMQRRNRLLPKKYSLGK
jgi:hypothetical protein